MGSNCYGVTGKHLILWNLTLNGVIFLWHLIGMSSQRYDIKWRTIASVTLQLTYDKSVTQLEARKWHEAFELENEMTDPLSLYFLSFLISQNYTFFGGKWKKKKFSSKKENLKLSERNFCGKNITKEVDTLEAMQFPGNIFLCST